MVRPVKPSPDPNSHIIYKTCKKCDAVKLLIDFPFSYRKLKSGRISYKNKCLVCERLQQKEMHKNRETKKAHTDFLKDEEPE